MSVQTKIIFITSDEDLVRQISLNNTKNTHIIDLDNDEQMISTKINDNNTIISTFCTDLLKHNSKNDQIINKRASDIFHHNRSKPVKVSKKSTDLVCNICGDRAIGYNYDVLSCASCKAFFRRYAYEDLEKLTCLSGQNECLIEYKTNRKCLRCRLKKCFTKGMRKDFLLSQEQLQQRRKHPGKKQNISLESIPTTEPISNPAPNSESVSEALDEIDHLLSNINEDDINIVLHETIKSNEMENILLEPLTVEDLAVIHNVQSAFLSVFDNQSESFPDSIDLSDRASALISWAQFHNELALQTIGFFRQIDEFENLHADNRFILIKYNLLPLLAAVKSYNYRPTNGRCPSDIYKETERKRRFYMLCDESNDVRDIISTMTHSIIQFTEQDPVLLSLLLIIFLFSPALPMNEDEPLLQDSLSVYRAQSFYTKVLWNYMVNKQGEIKACKQFTQLLATIFQIQLMSMTFQKFIRDQITTSNTVDKITSLMQTVLHIS